jgi:cyclic beta-1,2-glucan synthetase
MKRPHNCVIVGIYTAESDNAESACNRLRTNGFRCTILGTGKPQDAARAACPDVILDGEAVLVVPADRSQAQQVVEALRSGSKTPAVFVLSKTQRTERTPRDGQLHVEDRLRDAELALNAAIRELLYAARVGHPLSPSAAWLLDNAHLIRTHIAEIRRNLLGRRGSFLRRNSDAEQYVRVLTLAQQLVSREDHSIQRRTILEALDETQKTQPLTIAELWAFPLFLRLSLIESLARFATRVCEGQQIREAAYFWANRIVASGRRRPELLDHALHEMEKDENSSDNSFIIYLSEQLQDDESVLARFHKWLEGRLDIPPDELVRVEHNREAAECVSISNVFGSLRTLSAIDFPDIFEATSLVEAELRTDPEGIYPRSDFATRDQCRKQIERLALRSGIGEVDIARKAVRLALLADTPRRRTVTYYLLDEGMVSLEKEIGARVLLYEKGLRALRRYATPVYIGGIAFLTVCFLALSLAAAWELNVRPVSMLIVLGALALFPLSELSLQIVNALIISLLPPKTLPKMDFEDGIPIENATLVVVPMMLSSREAIEREAQKLEVRFLANRESHFYFSLFSDFTDAAVRTTVEDSLLLQTARRGIERLNERYSGGRFLLFHRPRSWSESEQKWIGRERKRGKIEELNAFLCGDGNREILRTGTLNTPIRFVITLDADTQLPPGTGRRLVETIAHPLNQVELDRVTKVHQRGFTIIQPRISISLPEATSTRFTRIFANALGTDPYCQAVSDAQQDLFTHAIFHGKAIYDVRSFHDSLDGRFPLETLLSHDLIEGAHAGVGLATDIELFENMPIDYSGFSGRQHRWIRGDWQIAPWILSRVPAADGSLVPNPLRAMDRWRVFDNLRRSLVPIASCLLLLLGWLISDAPGVWTLVLCLAFAIPVMAPLLDRAARHLQGTIRGWQGAADELLRAIVMLAFLPHQAWLSLDAIGKVFYRRWISRRNLLEWQTADAAHRETGRHAGLTMRRLLIVSGLSLLLIAALYARGALLPTAPVVALWAASPLIMRWLSLPAPVESPLRRHDALYLRQIARQTWRYFDDLVTPENNWLPPDNSQLALHVEVAQRTSPTNIGLWMTALFAAHDFGYITSDELVRRCSATMATLDKMERYEGHLLNWYDTRDLSPLTPRYVSTVDSGNLLAALWVLEQGCEELLRTPIIGSPCLRGLADTVFILREVCGEDPSIAVQLQAMRRILRGRPNGHALLGRLRLAHFTAEQVQDLRWMTPENERGYWASRLTSQVEAWNSTVERYLGWMEILIHPPDVLLRLLGPDMEMMRRRAVRIVPSLQTLAETPLEPLERILSRRGDPGLRPELAAWLEELSASYESSRRNAAEAIKNLKDLQAAVRLLANGMNMRFLYDEKKNLFGVGYFVGGPREFNSHYDLLASECRLASLVSIARGDVPVSHWFALGRPRETSGKQQTLLSWSGTMFEYLMPLLFTRTFANSLLDQACRNALSRQFEYGQEHEVPWGVSESAYSALDSNRTYQYRAFGVPQLALHQELKDALVVAPYATMLAITLDSFSALENLKRLEGLGLRGPMGFYEAIDFTREAKRDGERGVIIYTYMAHHQGMSLLALNNVLHRGATERRFHSDPRIQAFESLLFERIPITKPLLDEAQGAPVSVRVAHAEEPSTRKWEHPTAVPRPQLYGNGTFALMVTNSGTGYSRWNGLDLTRWRADSTLDPWGTFLYIRDVRAQTVWTATPRPLGSQIGSSMVHFAADRAEFHRQVLGIDTITHVTVSPEDDAELRRITITNRSLRSRRLELTSYLELALAPHATDRAHPAFSKLFIETEYVEEGLLIARRRLRAPEDPQVWAAHLVVSNTPGAILGIQHETDRSNFLGRGRTVEAPEALRRDLTGSTGAVLDPIFSLRCTVNLDPRERIEVCFITIAASSREALNTISAKYRRPDSITRAFEMAWTRSQLEFRHLGIGPAGAHRFQELAGPLLFPDAALRTSVDRLFRNKLGQSTLWAYGVSGDLPILCVTAADSRSLALIREVLIAHSYWRARGFQADLIILNQESPSYDHPLRVQLQSQIEAHSGQTGVDKPGGVFLRNWDAIPEDHRNLILSAANVVLSGNRGTLQQQLQSLSDRSMPAVSASSKTLQVRDPQPLPFPELPYFNGIGGFRQDGREYEIYLKPGQCTPAPWINVVANADFGATVGESGLGFTWRGNSQTHRLTPWHNDPVADPQSEAIYIRDDDTGEYWSPTPMCARSNQDYCTRHGQGYTVFEHNGGALEQELAVFVPISAEGAGDPVKIYRLRMRNLSHKPRKLSITFFAEWVLGSQREEQQRHIQTSWDEEAGAVLARQTWTGSDGVAFAASSPKATSYTGDRTQFLGAGGSRSQPAALESERLDNRTGAALDPAAALRCQVSLEPGNTAHVIFLLGETSGPDQVRNLVARYSTVDQVKEALDGAKGFWDAFLGRLQVRTPLLSADLLLNRWLLYQVLSCRYWGRSALYQSGGAFGFRDQLQDCMGLVYAAPHITRAHILRCAARQFTEGDAQHWWHPDTGSGVRTHCSDDFLWLPYAVSHYVEVTGDTGILEEEVPFLEGAPLRIGEQDRLFVPTISRQTAPLWEHCRRALDRATTFGSHGLPLIGTGDWNDGLNRVGIEGKGESGWLSWFLCAVLRDFANIIDGVPSGPSMADEFRKRADHVAQSMESNGWDGEWYLRGFFDDGTPLGSRLSAEAMLDSLPQSWAVIAAAGDAERARQALDSAERLLVDERNKIVRLFTPPFDHSEPNPGYIIGYPPGVRENGGQYTHGSLWLAMARARLGDGEAAVRLLQLMNPVERTRTPGDVARYRGEPYAVAADVSANPYCPGRSGWTWYTGSAAWMYRIWIEEVLGFHLRGNLLTLNPAIPRDWPGFEIRYRFGSTMYEITVTNNSTRQTITVDGHSISSGTLQLVDDGGVHSVNVSVSAAESPVEVAESSPAEVVT